MGLLEDSEDDISSKHEELCRSLNLDAESGAQAWSSYETIRTQYTLEGEQLHWLGCALYVACRNVSPPSVGPSDSLLQGNGVNLTRLLRLCNLSLLQFFSKSKQWVYMANMPSEYRTEIERLERNFEVSTEMFKKFQPIFNDMFLNSEDDQPKHPRSRKLRNIPCTSAKVFEFCWILFVYVKGIVHGISDDIVNSYHYLFACCDLMFANALLAERDDLINPNFPGLPENWKANLPLTNDHCVLDTLCQRHDGICLEAKTIKEYHWKVYIRDLIKKKILRGDQNTLGGILDQNSFEQNLKNVNREYEAYVLNKGDFDERIFLAECRRLRALRKQKLSSASVLRAALQELNSEDDANFQIGSPARLVNDTSESTPAQRENHQHLVPSTPLTGRNYLSGGLEPPVGATPISTATHSVSHLHTLLSGRTSTPSAALEALFSECQNNPKEKIESKITEWGALFCSKYTQATPENANSHINFAKIRFDLAKTLCYKLLEDILLDEKRKKPNLDLSTLVDKDIFHHCLFTCCLEIVIYSYNSQKKFPWILEAMEIESYYFYKVIELIVSIKDHLSRNVVKHLNSIEEQVLQSMAWRRDSPLWAAIADSNLPVPRCEEVSIRRQFTTAVMNESKEIILRDTNNAQTVNLPHTDKIISDTDQSPNVSQSPVSSASERFRSPIDSNLAKKRLFQDNTGCRTIKPGQSVLQNTKMLVKVAGVILQAPAIAMLAEQLNHDRRAKRGGSLGLFFRKFYKMASVRIQELCDKLDVTDEEIRQKIWTCFEYSIMNFTELMKDRHLDQILMCAVYVVCKVSGQQMERNFAEIMRCYRMQPQASSHVYRSVLLNSRASFGLSENRGDLILFYNSIYVKKMQNYVLQFSGRGSQPGALELSPLPDNRMLLNTSPSRRISQNVSVRSLSISNALNHSPGGKPLVYCFSRSPAKDLRAINDMISSKKIGKRLLSDDPIEDGAPPCKQAGPVMTRKLQGLLSDRRDQTKDGN